MANQALTKEQEELIPLVKKYRNDFYLVGGTALTLQIKHRFSIDFDLFSKNPLNYNLIDKFMDKFNFKKHVIRKTQIEYTINLNNVKITFFQYPHPIPHRVMWNNIIFMPTVLDIATMKVYALGRRAKWKDYVDLYFILSKHSTFKEICDQTTKHFGTMFNEKLFREQLSYFKDINYSEKVAYLPGAEKPSDQTIKNYLRNVALQKI